MNRSQLKEFGNLMVLKLQIHFSGQRFSKLSRCSRGERALIDYILVNHELASQVKHTRVYRGKDISPDYSVIVIELTLRTRWRKT